LNDFSTSNDGTAATTAFGGYGIYAVAGTNGTAAGNFVGDVNVEGTLFKSSGAFKIDHPLDPENKYLIHSFVESPDMKNVYDGVVTTDGTGYATVALPDWFEALNRDFRYQLTVVGPQFSQAIVASEIVSNHFTIRTDHPGVKVSWQVTGILQDQWANAHRLPTEVEKDEKEKGHYIHPELFGHEGEPTAQEMQHPVARPQAPPERGAIR
jgi:trimeric autotransporter adhesin